MTQHAWIRSVVLVAIALLQAACRSGDSVSDAKMDTQMETEGIWQSTEEVEDSGAMGSLSDTKAFAVDGGKVTMMLLSFSKFRGISEDNCYRLDARWADSTLLYRLPNGAWEELAVWVDGHFEMKGSGMRRIFSKVQPEQVLEFYRPILKPGRAHYNYNP